VCIVFCEYTDNYSGVGRRRIDERGNKRAETPPKYLS
jgi:hypothetical protein